MAWCAQCHVEFTPTRDGQKYHSNSCRQKAYRRRHWARGASQVKTDPLREYRDRLRDLGVQIPEAEPETDPQPQRPAAPNFVAGNPSNSVTRDVTEMSAILKEKADQIGMTLARLEALIAIAESDQEARDFLRQIGLS